MSDLLDDPWVLSRRRAIGVSIVSACAAAISSAMADARKLQLVDELYQTADRSELLAAARTIAGLEIHGTFITTGASGNPKARPMSADFGDEDGSFWMLTKPHSRKLAQLENSSQSLLHFPDNEEWGYVSFMGKTQIHRDEETITQRAFFPEELRDRLSPDFPAGVVALQFKAEALEVAGRGISVHQETWQPQGITL